MTDEQKKPPAQYSKDFSFELSLPALNDKQKAILVSLRDTKMECGDSGLVHAHEVTFEQIQSQAELISSITDPVERKNMICGLLQGFVLLATDVEWIADYAVKAEQSISDVDGKDKIHFK